MDHRYAHPGIWLLAIVVNIGFFLQLRDDLRREKIREQNLKNAKK